MAYYRECENADVHWILARDVIASRKHREKSRKDRR